MSRHSIRIITRMCSSVTKISSIRNGGVSIVIPMSGLYSSAVSGSCGGTKGMRNISTGSFCNVACSLSIDLDTLTTTLLDDT